MKRLSVLIVAGVAAACSASGSSGSYLLDAGPDGEIEPVIDAGVQESGKADAAKKDANTSTGPLVIKNLSYGGTSVSTMDVTFGVTGNVDVDRVSSIDFQFAGDAKAASISLTCSTGSPWNAPGTAVQTLLFSYYSSSTYYVKYPCGGAQTTGYTNAAVGFGDGFGGDLTVTFKGLATDGAPFTISVTGSKR